MKINIHTDGIIITAKQKAMMEKKLSRMKRYLPDENIIIDLLLKDETSEEKGGVDQNVHINATFGKEKIFIEEEDDRLLRAFAIALKRFERQLSRYHRKRIDKVKRGGGGRFEKLLKVIKRKK
jgi:ribosomal subunit interface protein